MPGYPSSSSSQFVENSPYKVRIEYDGSGNPIYIGETQQGILESQSFWRIKKITYVSGNATQIDWADSSELFTKIWDNRASYTYA